MKYKGRLLDYGNLSDFLLELGTKGAIPYSDCAETYKRYKMFDPKTNALKTYRRPQNDCILKEIKWSIEYSGSWGLGYSSNIKFNMETQEWTVWFVADMYEDQRLELNQSFQTKIMYGMAIASSKNLEDIIEYPFYYGLFYNLNSNQTTEYN